MKWSSSGNIEDRAGWVGCGIRAKRRVKDESQCIWVNDVAIYQDGEQRGKFGEDPRVLLGLIKFEMPI